MMNRKLAFAMLVAALLVTLPAAAQESPGTLEQVVERIVAREAQLVEAVRQYSPLVETYLQELEPDPELGMRPKKDYYFLGKADLARGMVLHSLTDKKSSDGWGSKVLSPFKAVGRAFSFTSDYRPGGFLNKLFVDTRGLDKNYRLEYVRREFLGEVRCLVFDVHPDPEGDGRFKGRIWVEDEAYTIVRFNGIRTPERTATGYKFHFDSWRVSAGEGLWVPAYIYTAESDLKDYFWKRVRFKAQTRLWGYDLKNRGRTEEFSSIRVEMPTEVVDQSETSPDRSPIEAQRLWQRQAEENVVERLELAGLLAPPGEVDKILDTVVNNLEVTNNLNIEPRVRCRVLLTSRLESFAFGHTIVVSRGLLDVLPDETSLAAVLAHELAHILHGTPVDANRWGFSDRLLFPVEEAFQHFSFRSDAPEASVGEKALELLQNSPYKDKLPSAGLFLRQLQHRAEYMPNLVSPHLGNAVQINPALVSAAPELDPDQTDQIAALPLGARVKLDPWSNQVTMAKPRPVPIYSARDKLPFEVTPFMPYLTRHRDTTPAEGVAAQSQQPTQQPETKPQPPPQP